MKKLSDSEATQKKYYNSISAEYDRYYGSKEAIKYRSELYAAALKDVPLEGVTILDAMCGGGQNTAALQGHNSLFVGVDLSDEQCLNYQRRFPGTQVKCASILDSGLEDSSFDIVVCDSLHHLHPYVNGGVKELLRVLKPGGHLLLWEPSAGSIFDRLRKLWYRLDKKFFEPNEAAIDIKRLALKHENVLELKAVRYGGNVAYLFVFASMAFRIPVKIVPIYSGVLMWIESILGLFQTRFTSLWALALFRKR